ncbi:MULTISPECIES: ribosome hibernation-promoting factor, HPF/YfiA family [Peptoniphilus]|uniref:ribosome hibernation-promoting factor, HPF/YfiA family n=1 Tax=Peptoniphilus TaxID=162289 RepID=UPI0001DA99E5|nr:MULTISPECIES: ribosome-associated translation inhibitor RaiA [Peptoniphilus]EFI41791.1 ribosomal subunit interface protein [Peptoniphilus sp. oral taxon 386 str. F0131]
MLLKLVGKNMELTESLKKQAEKKFSKIDKFFDEEVEARAVFSTQKGSQTVEVTIFLPGTILRAEETTQDMYASIDKVVDVLERQIRKYKTRLKKRYQGNSKTIRFENVREAEVEEESSVIVKRKQLLLRPMHEEEATLQMELLNHNFFIFLNTETDKIEVVYKRHDDNYGIIDIDIE